MKALVEPLAWCLFALAVGLGSAFRRGPVRCKRIAGWLLAICIGLSGLATKVVRDALCYSLAVPSSAAEHGSVDYIVVLGGGYVRGARPEEDLLVLESSRRVLHAFADWQRHPEAGIVLSGTQKGEDGVRSAQRLVNLMADDLGRRGVPSSAIVLESASQTTREHPRRLVALPGMSPTSRIILVTSEWHMRRARAEFCRVFSSVVASPATVAKDGFGVRDLLPNAAALESSTTYLREWIGVIWYLSTGISEPAALC